MGPVLLQVPLGTRKAPWEVQWDHTDLSAQHFWVTLAASCASKPPLNERVEASGSHGHLSLANHPGAHRPLAPAAGARCVLWPLARWHVACRAKLCGHFCLAADLACCEMVESGGAALRKGLAMSVGKCESRGFQF